MLPSAVSQGLSARALVDVSRSPFYHIHHRIIMRLFLERENKSVVYDMV
jgi:hypothetical protein